MKLKNRFKTMIVVAAITISAICVHPVCAYADEEVYWPEGPQIDSPNAIVMEVNTGTVLYEKNSHEQHYPASITKILTTYLAILNCDMDEKVTFSADAVYKNEGDTSNISRDLGEEMTMEQTLYGIMLESANECAYAAAEHVGQKLGGDYSTFIDLMNKTAQELGCTDTHFNNANGLPDDQHWTSAYDMALISCAAYKNEEFRKITGTKSYRIPPTNKHSSETPLNNHHALLHPYRSLTQYVNPYCTGGKTGYTTVANSTLVTYAEKDGLTLCVVIMNANSPSHYVDTNTLINYCFSNFKAVDIASNENTSADENTQNLGVLNDHGLYAKVSENYVVLPNNAEFSEVTREEDDEKSDTTDAIATIKYKYGDKVVGKVDLVKSDTKVDLSYFDTDKNKNSSVIKIKPIYIGLLILMLVLLIALIFLAKKASENFYVIKHKWDKKKEQRVRFREQKQKRRRRRKSKKRDNISFKTVYNNKDKWDKN